MKLNEIDFAAFASSLVATDKAGWLWKRGAEFSHLNPTSSRSHLSQFKKRWFVLKGNLLFYFKHKSAAAPVGMVLLENCQVSASRIDDKNGTPQDFFPFELSFTHQLSAKNGGRRYQLLAESHEESQQWCKAINNASLVRSRAVAQKLWDRCHQNKRVIDQLVGQIKDLQSIADVYQRNYYNGNDNNDNIINAYGESDSPVDDDLLIAAPPSGSGNPSAVADTELNQMRESLNGIVRNLRSLFDRDDSSIEVDEGRYPMGIADNQSRNSSGGPRIPLSSSVPMRLTPREIRTGSPINVAGGSGDSSYSPLTIPSADQKENTFTQSLSTSTSVAAISPCDAHESTQSPSSFQRQSVPMLLNFSKTAVQPAGNSTRPLSLLSSSLPPSAASVNHVGVPPSPPALLSRSLSRRRSGGGLPPRFSALSQSLSMTTSERSSSVPRSSSDRTSADYNFPLETPSTFGTNNNRPPSSINITRLQALSAADSQISHSSSAPSPTALSSSTSSLMSPKYDATTHRQFGLPFPGSPPLLDDLPQDLDEQLAASAALDISFSCRLNPEIVALMRGAISTNLTSNLVGSLVNGTTRNPETAIITYERRYKRVETGEEWGWHEVGRTEFAELKDAKHVEYLVPLSFQFFDMKGGSDYRFELHNFIRTTASGASETKCFAFIECTDKQLFSGLKERDRKSVSLYDSHGEKLLSVNLFTPPDIRFPGSTIAGGEIVGELFIALGEPIKTALAPIAPFSESPYDVSQRYNVQTSVHEPLKIKETLRESPYAFLVPLALLKAFMATETAVIDELYRMERVLLPTVSMTCSCRGHASKKCFLPHSLDLIRSRQIEAHSDLKSYFQQVHDSLEERLSMLDGRWMRQSIDKKDVDLQWVALNCCQHDMLVEDVQNREYSVHGITSVGAPTAHAMGFTKVAPPAYGAATFYTDQHLFAGQVQPNSNSLSADFATMARNQLKLTLSSSKDQLGQYRINFSNLLEQLRESLFSLADLPLHAEQLRRKAIHENIENLIKDIQWVANDIVNFTRDISWSSPYSSLSNRHKTPCGGFVQLNTEAELVRLSDRIIGKYLPDLADMARSLIINLDSQSKMERERIDDVLRSLKLEAPYLAPSSESLGGIAQASTNSLSALGHCLHTVTESVNQLIEQSSDLLEQETLICDYLAMNSASLPSGNNGSFFRSSAATTSPGAFSGSSHLITLQLRKRRDACLSQLLGAIVTGFVSMIHRHFQKRFRYSSAYSAVSKTLSRSRPMSSVTESSDINLSRSYSTSRQVSTNRNPIQSAIDSVFWEGLLQIGYLAHFESLLSAQGDEKGMLEDMRQSMIDVAENVRFAIHCLQDNDNTTEKAVIIVGSRHSLTVSIGLPEWIYRSAPTELTSRRSLIRVFPILFAQGINEQQVIANLSGDSRLQERINIDGFKGLEEFVTRWRNWIQRRVAAQSSDDSMRAFAAAAVQFQLPDELLDVVDGLMAEIRMNMGLESSNPVEFTRKYATRTDPSLMQDDLRILTGNLSNSDPNDRRSSEAAFTDPSAGSAVGQKKWKLSIKNNTTLLLLVSHLVRILSTANPMDPLGGCSTAFSEDGSLTLAAGGGRKSPDIYPTCPVASRFTSCKSAKDRTSMSVTLEHVLTLRHRGQRQPSATVHPHDREPVHGQSPRTVFLKTLAAEKQHVHFPLHPDYFTKLLDAMRGEQGCRLSNVERNLNIGWGAIEVFTDRSGQNHVPQEMQRNAENKWIQSAKRGEYGKYAFNAFQWALLPTLYRPPMRVLGGGTLT